MQRVKKSSTDLKNCSCYKLIVTNNHAAYIALKQCKVCIHPQPCVLEISFHRSVLYFQANCCGGTRIISAESEAVS